MASVGGCFLLKVELMKLTNFSQKTNDHLGTQLMQK